MVIDREKTDDDDDDSGAHMARISLRLPSRLRANLWAGERKDNNTWPGKTTAVTSRHTCITMLILIAQSWRTIQTVFKSAAITARRMRRIICVL